MIRPLVVTASHPLPEAVRALLACAPIGTAHLLDALGLLVHDPRLLADWLRSLRDDPDATREVAWRSYRHPNGFAKLVLHNAQPQFCVRMHVWGPGSGRRGETNPHSHRWDFASTVLVGAGLTITEYAECATGGVLHERFWYGRGADPGSSELLVDGIARLRTLGSRSIQPHGRYTTDTQAVHTVDPLGASLVATLVVQGPRRVGRTIVYRTPGAGAEQRNGILDELDVRLLVEDVLAAIEPQGDVAP